MNPSWIAERMERIEGSGIRKIFELARSMKNPVNLSIGQPHFPVPDPIKDAAIEAIRHNQNGYTVTQGIASLLDKLQTDVQSRLPNSNREVMATSGVSGGLMLAMATVINPGDEVILFDPYFVSYPHLVTLVGGKPVIIDTYPTFDIDIDQLKAAITPRTKMILFASPGNPTGVTLSVERLKQLADLARERNILLVSDEIYRLFHFDEQARSAAEFNDDVLVLEGFGKTYGITGWRLGYAHGPKLLIEEMTKLQQFTFVCPPSMVQQAGVAALDYDCSAIVADYRRKRNLICESLQDKYEFVKPSGAFYLYVKSPRGTATDFVKEAIANNLLIIPGSAFGAKDTHVRISFAASDETLQRGIEILRKLFHS